MSLPSTRPRWQPWHRQAWSLLNASTAPVWLLMLIAPRAGVTRAVVDRSMPLHAALGGVYLTLLARGVVSGGERVDFTDGESVARGLSTPEGALIGWTHFLTFDLFVGAWIWRTSLEEGVDGRLATALTWWFGPLGLTLFQWQRRRAARSQLARI